MPALKWLRMLMNHIPDKYEHLFRYYGYYSNRSRGARMVRTQPSQSALTTVNRTTRLSRRRSRQFIPRRLERHTAPALTASQFIPAPSLFFFC